MSYLTAGFNVSGELAPNPPYPGSDQNFSMRAGDDKRITVTIIDGATGGRKDISGSSARWSMARGSVSVLKTTATGGIVITNGPQGVLDIVLVPSDTAAMAPGVYRHELEVVDASGQSATVMAGDVHLRRALLP